MRRGILNGPMKKHFLFIAISIIATIALAPAKASALNLENDYQFDILNLNFNAPLSVIERPEDRVLIPPSTTPAPEAPKPPEPAKPREYIVKSGDNLSKIAKEQKTTWPRLWNKNKDLDNPDLIQIGQVILIPDESEDLEDRPIPATTPPQAATAISSNQTTYQRGSSSGNRYTPGYCTWYVKNKRPDLPNNLGNAHTWAVRAAAQGIPTGTSPRAGAVGVSTAGDLGHVVYVERVNGDGTITISEMNYGGLWQTNTRTVSPSLFSYIY